MAQSDNPFAKWATTQQPTTPQTPAPQPAAPAPGPAAVVIGNDNPFAGMKPKTQDTPVDTWWTTVRGNRVQFTVPRGSTVDQVRNAAKTAGVPDPQNRSLQFAGSPDKVPTGPTPEQANNNYGPIGTSVHEGVDSLFPYVDEIASMAAAPFGSGDVPDNYSNNMNYLEQRQRNSNLLYPSEGTGGRVGAFLATLPMAAEAKFMQGANTVGTALRTAPTLGTYAAFNAYGSNPEGDRWNGVPLSALVGTGIGAVAPFATKAIGAAAQRIDQRLGISDVANRAFNYILGRPQTATEAADQAAARVIASRTSQSPSQMRAAAQEMRDLGHTPTFVNVTDESGRGLVSAAARKSVAGRQIAQDAYDTRAMSLPDRADRNMQTVIQDSTANDAAPTATLAELNRPPADIAADLKVQRNSDMEAAMAPIRSQQVALSPRLIDILNTRDGAQALSQAMRAVTDPETLNSMKNLQSLMRSGAFSNIPAGLSPAARESVMQQLIGKNGMTVDIADRLARKFNAMGETAPSDTQRALYGFGREIRDAAKAASPDYAAALQKYGDTSGTMKAMDVGSDFLKPNTDEFVKRASNISGVSPAPGVPSDQQYAMASARRAVQAATGENVTGAAPGVVRKIGISPEQSQRNNALFGPVNADKLEKMMAMSAKDLQDYAQVAPRTGSQTAIRGEDAQTAGHAITAMHYLSSGRPVMAALHLLRSAGMREADATRIVQMATDPAQTDKLINMLEQSYGKQTALKMSRFLGVPAAQEVGQNVGGSR